MRKLPVFFKGNEPDLILAAATRPRDAVLVLVLLGMGLRVSEVCNLLVEHIDLGRRLLTVREGKGMKDRVLPIPKKVQMAVESWLLNGGACIYLFPSPYGGPLSPRAVQYLMKRLARDAGLPDWELPRRVNPHKFRHAFATRMWERTRDLLAVKEAMGHEDVRSTQIYTHCSVEHLRKGMEI